MRKLLLAVSLVLLSYAPAFAKVESLEGASLGEHWYGPKETLETVKGHVVFWENWGYK